MRNRWSSASAALLAGLLLGGVAGLVFGLASLNRPLLNAAVFALLGAGIGLLAALLALAVKPGGRRRSGSARHPHP